jgi:hypothetical protein
VAGVVLFFIYLRVSRTYPENSDEANVILMAHDLLHGNLLLHGWSMSDVSFYTTELPQYALLEALHGAGPDVAHVGAAMTYTLVVLLAAALAKAGGSWGRAALVAGIMLAPQLGPGVFVLLFSVGHIGTAVPLLATWIVVDRARRHWAVPVVVGLMLTWGLIADSIVEIGGVVPLVLVCLFRAARGYRAEGVKNGVKGGLKGQWYELSLAAAAVLAYGLAQLVIKVVHALGGFLLHPVPYKLAPLSELPKHLETTLSGLLALFGARFTGEHGIGPVFAALHLVGLAIVVWAAARVLRHFLGATLVDQVLVVAIIVNLALYAPSTLASGVLNAREFVLVLPYGAVLAARVLRLPRAGRARRVLVPALLVVLAGYAASLGYAATRPAAPAAKSDLARWLLAHHLYHGVGGYWEASIVTVDTGGRVTIRAVEATDLVQDDWMAKPSWYNSPADFLVTDDQPGNFNFWKPFPRALARWGTPARTYRVGHYTIIVWNTDMAPRTH